MRKNPHVRICGGLGSATTLVYPTLAGLQRYLVFFVIALQSRRVTIAGIHPQPYGTWMEQMARNVTDPVDGCVRRARYLIHDRDPLSTRGLARSWRAGGSSRSVSRRRVQFQRVCRAVRPLYSRGVSQSRRPPRRRAPASPRGRVRRPTNHRERNHQGLDNQLLQRPPPPVSLAADVQRRERLGGWLNFYHREAA